jgi:DNA-binding SARP family transcriptional activator
MSNDDGAEASVNVADGLRIHLFGAPEIQIGGADWSLSDQKARALLFYLAATARAHTRDHLATLFWSESPESNARHSFRSSLHHLRQSLLASGAAGILVAGGGQVHLQLRRDECDVARFRQLIAANSEHTLAEAVALYRGPLLEGVILMDAPVFEDWLRSEAAELNHAYLSALGRLVTLAETRQAWSEAVAYAQQIVQMDPLDEAAQRRLMQLYLQSGATGRALRQYQQLEMQLQRDLGLTPSPETQELLHEALRPRQGSAPLAVAIPPPPQFAASLAAQPTSPRIGRNGGEWIMPFVGREGPLAQLLAISQDAYVEHGITVLLQGDAGMGKTRLLGELATRLSTHVRPWMVLHGSCSPFDDLLSYGPFYDALQSAAPGDLTDLLAVEHGTVRAEAGTIMWRVLQSLRLLTQSGPLLLAIDDLHWANSATLRLFGFLATRIRTLPVLLVGTIQHPEAIPAVQRLLAVGRPRGEVHVVPVTPLALEAITALLHALGLGPDSAASLAEWLHERSGGIPFILSEILAQLRAEAILTPDGSSWQLDAARWVRRRISFTLPETTYDLMAWRLASLAPEALHLLEVLAVAGQPLSFALLRDLSGTQAAQCLQMVDDLLARGLLVETTGDTLALPHHLMRETLLARVSQLRRRTLHRQLLAALEQHPVLDTHVRLRQLALHAVAGEDTDRARTYGLQVVDELLHSEPSAEALDFLHHLYDLLAPTTSHGESLRLSHALGRFHQSLGQIKAATYWHQQHLELARAAGDRVAQATAHFEMGELALVTNEYAQAATAANAGLDLGERHGEPQLAVLMGRGYRLLGASKAMEGSDLLAAEQYLEQAVSAHRQAESTGDLCADLFELGNVAAQRGAVARALALYDEARHAAEAGHVSYFLALAYNNFAYHSLLLGHVDAAQQAATQGQHVAETHELVGALLHLYSTQGEIQLYLAEWDLAAKCFRRGLALAEELGNLERQAGYCAGVALTARGQYDFERATALLEEARILIAEQGYWHLRTRILLWLAETWLLRERVDEAWPPLKEALATAQSQGRELLLIQGQRLRAQLLTAGGKWAEAHAVFADTLRRAISLDLPLEVARTQAAYGRAMCRSALALLEGHQLMEAAHDTFTAHNARAELQSIALAPRT